MSLVLHDGSLFANRYRVVRCIATGGMGAVYEAAHAETGRRCALKVMLPHIVQSPELRERFMREARVTAQIESEFIVDVLDAGVDDATGMPFLVMELLRGEELGQRLARLGRFAPAEAITYLYQTALALDRTHQNAIVHRDLKPQNLFLTQRDDGAPKIKVLDFGVAKIVADGAIAAQQTRNLGTPFYMSPEQFMGEGHIGPPSDIYALGIISFTLLTGEPYWATELNQDSNMYAFVNTAVRGPQEPATVRAARRGVTLPPAFDAWFTTVAASNPAQRFPTATSAIAALGQIFGVPLAAAPALTQAAGFTTGGGVVKPASRPSKGSLLVAGLSIVFLVIVGALVQALRAPSAESASAPASPGPMASAAPTVSASAQPEPTAEPSAIEIDLEGSATPADAPPKTTRPTSPTPPRVTPTKPKQPLYTQD